jgi:hypothetical protein
VNEINKMLNWIGILGEEEKKMKRDLDIWILPIVLVVTFISLAQADAPDEDSK